MDDLSREYRIENTAERCVYMQCRGINGQTSCGLEDKGTQLHSSLPCACELSGVRSLRRRHIAWGPEMMSSPADIFHRVETANDGVVDSETSCFESQTPQTSERFPRLWGETDGEVCFVIFQKIPQTEGKLAPHSDSLIVALLTTADKDKRGGSVQLADICWWWL